VSKISYSRKTTLATWHNQALNLDQFTCMHAHAHTHTQMSVLLPIRHATCSPGEEMLNNPHMHMCTHTWMCTHTHVHTFMHTSGMALLWVASSTTLVHAGFHYRRDTYTSVHIHVRDGEHTCMHTVHVHKHIHM